MTEIETKASHEANLIINEIQAFMKTHKISKTALSKAIGRKQQYINGYFNHPRLETITLIVKGLESVTGLNFHQPSFVAEKPNPKCPGCKK